MEGVIDFWGGCAKSLPPLFKMLLSTLPQSLSHGPRALKCQMSLRVPWSVRGAWPLGLALTKKNPAISHPPWQPSLPNMTPPSTAAAAAFVAVDRMADCVVKTNAIAMDNSAANNKATGAQTTMDDVSVFSASSLSSANDGRRQRRGNGGGVIIRDQPPACIIGVDGRRGGERGAGAK